MSKIIKGKDLEKTVGLKKTAEILLDSFKEPLGLSTSLIKKDASKTQKKGLELLEAASKRAQEVTREIDAILEQARQVYQAEKKRGYAEGRQEGLASATAKITAAHAAHERILSQSEEEIVKLIRAVTEKVIAREVETGAVVDLVKRSIGQILGNQITIRVNPEDVHFLKEKEGELMALIDGRQTITFREDPVVARGGCIVDSELGTIDAQLPAQIAAIKKSLGI